MSARDSVIFIHRGAWGDLYVSTAALAEAAAAHPHARLYVVGSEKWLQILDPATWPTLQGIVTTENGRTGDLHERADAAGGKPWMLAESQISLRRFYARALATYNIRTESLRFAWAPWLARVPRRHGSAPAPWSQFLYTHRAPWLGKDPILHERDRMLQVVEAPDRIGELARKWREGTGLPQLKAHPDRARAEGLTGAEFGRYWLLNPTSSRREKAWPSEKFRELFAHLAPRLAAEGIKVRALGAPAETEWLREIVPDGVDPSRAIVQPPDVRSLLDVLAGARALVTNTSSVQFLSPGMGVRTLTLMGRGNPAIWGPLGPDDIVVRGEINRALDADMFAQERDAYRSITLESVLVACEAMMRSSGPSRRG